MQKIKQEVSFQYWKDRGLGVSPNFQSPPKYGGLIGGLDSDSPGKGDYRELDDELIHYSIIT